MNKLLKVLTCACMVVGLAACTSKEEEQTPTTSGSDTITATYSYYVQGYDYGCAVVKATIKADNVIDAIKAEDLVVTETKKATDWTDPEFKEAELTSERTIVDAYLSDENGEKTTEASNYITVELAEDPNTGSPFTYSLVSGRNTWCDPYYLTITLAEGAKVTSNGTEVTSFTVNTEATAKSTSADMFEVATGEYEGVTYKYATYEPETESDTLVVWLHGGGEGGLGLNDNSENSDPYVVLLANEAANLAGEDFQKAVGGAYVLAPQCPTYWIDVDGTCSGAWEHADGTSYYTESLIALIDAYIEETGVSKVVISGCSNGGYMTAVIAKEYGDKYDAYVPICAPLDSAAIDEEDLANLVSVPLYFIYSEDDTTVPPTEYEIDVIARLKAAGHANLCVSTTEHVVDTSHNYDDADGNQYTYSGHWSWIYFDNNESTCDDCGTSVFEWIANAIAE